MAEAQQQQLLILTINEQIGGEYQAERSVKPELWHSASFCSIIPFEIGARVGPSPTPAIKGPGVCSQKQPSFPLRRHFTVSQARSNALWRPVFLFLRGGEAGRAPGICDREWRARAPPTH